MSHEPQRFFHRAEVVATAGPVTILLPGAGRIRAAPAPAAGSRASLRLSAAGGLALAFALCAAAAHGATITLNGTARDFNSNGTTFAGVAGHVDFENTSYPTNGEKGLVNNTLGSNGKPTLSSGTKSSVNSAASFAQWYVTTSGVNSEVPISLVLEDTVTQPGVFRYNNSAFFPIDGRGFNQQSGPSTNRHNFGFTTEFRTHFTYQAGKGESFSFSGDDDVFIFVNRILAVDLGGIHATQSATVNLDTIAASHALVSGRVYSLDIFHAERRTETSAFVLRSTITSLQSGAPASTVPEPGTLALAVLGLAAAAWTGKRARRRHAAS